MRKWSILKISDFLIDLKSFILSKIDFLIDLKSYILLETNCLIDSRVIRKSLVLVYSDKHRNLKEKIENSQNEVMGH